MTALARRLQSAGGKIDPVWAAILAILAAIALASAEQGWRSFIFTLENLLSVSPFLLGSVALAAYAKASDAEGLIARAFAGRESTGILIAALVGALSPFCSCGVIPLIAALLAVGVPLGPVMAFWLASPIMDPAMFVLTSGTLGTEFALYKTFAAVVMGLAGGFGIQVLLGMGLFAQPLRREIAPGGCGTKRVEQPKPVVWRFWHEAGRREKFWQAGADSLLFLTKWLTLAYLLESLMLAYVPDHLVAQYIGGQGWVPVIAATFLGIPAYLNGYAALPLIDGLLDQGMAPGAAMAFLLAGGVTSIPAAIAVYALARLPVFLAYLGFALLGSLGLGLLFGLASIAI